MLSVQGVMRGGRDLVRGQLIKDVVPAALLTETEKSSEWSKQQGESGSGNTITSIVTKLSSIKRTLIIGGIWGGSYPGRKGSQKARGKNELGYTTTSREEI